MSQPSTPSIPSIPYPPPVPLLRPVGPPEYHHYGLAARIYTHFTSPIRRYADVVVHRLLAAALGLQPLPDSARDRWVRLGLEEWGKGIGAGGMGINAAILRLTALLHGRLTTQLGVLLHHAQLHSTSTPPPPQGWSARVQRQPEQAAPQRADGRPCLCGAAHPDLLQWAHRCG